MEVKYVKYLKILSIPEREREKSADIKTERIASSERVGESLELRVGVKVTATWKRNYGIGTVEGGRRTFQLVIKTCRAVTLAPTPSRHSSTPPRYNEALALLYRRRRHRRHLVN